MELARNDAGARPWRVAVGTSASVASMTSSLETALPSFRSIVFSELSLTTLELTLLAGNEAATADRRRRPGTPRASTSDRVADPTRRTRLAIGLGLVEHFVPPSGRFVDQPMVRATGPRD